ncbi:PQQ-binding-like beta-propeller repeat protein [Brevibacillus fortis]|uniref:outer membrane protein assembly factor BamB family protein n=1 Tax=Brevibacillus fortis TaxID=2126352 RepID=UPI002E1EABEE|nr:PQQ-binding-like beta-propeller repeat protein [Brevibacillus fortis]
MKIHNTIIALLLGVSLAFPIGTEAQSMSSEQTTPITVLEDGVPKKLKMRGADRFEIKWNYNGGQKYFSEVVDEATGTMYLLSENGVLHALNPKGQVIWQSDLGLDWAHDLKIGKDGSLYVLNDNISEFEYGEPAWIHAIDKAGKERWTMKLPHMYSYDMLFDVSADGIMFMLTDKEVTAANQEAKLVWANDQVATYESDSYLSNDVIRLTWIESIKTLLVERTDNKLAALDQNGKIKWQRENVQPGAVYVSEDGMVYTVGEKGLTFLHASDGKDRAEAPVDAATLNKVGIPHDGKGNYYREYNDYTIWKVDRTGKKLWSYNRPKEQTGTLASQLVSDRQGNVFFSDTGGSIFSLDPNGKERFIVIRNDKMFTYTRIWIGSDGVLYASADGMGILAIAPRGK